MKTLDSIICFTNLIVTCAENHVEVYTIFSVFHIETHILLYDKVNQYYTYFTINIVLDLNYV